MQRPAVLKLRLGARTHRVAVDLAALSLDALVAHVEASLGDALPALWALEYADDEGDRVTLARDRELPEALAVLLSQSQRRSQCKSERDPTETETETETEAETDGPPTLAFTVAPRAVPLRARLAPLLRRVSDLSAAVARVASERSLQLRHSDVVSRGRASLSSSASRTGSLLRSASHSVASGLQHAGSAVSARLERRRSRGSSASGASSPPSSPSSPSPRFSECDALKAALPNSPTPTGEGDQVATVDLRASLSASERDSVGERVEEQTQQQTAYESDTDTLASCDEEDRDWDLVAPPAAASPNSVAPLIAENSWRR